MKGDSDFWVQDGGDQLPFLVKRKRKARSKILEFNGWASTALIDFLVSIGRDTSKKLSENDVANIVKEYINNNKLIIPEKKKRVMCDERLLALFGKKSIPRVKIQNLLGPHFFENQYVSSSEDEYQHDSDEEGVNSVQMGKKASKVERKHSSQKQKVPEPPKSCFAAVIPANIKLVYLKKSLLQELAKVPESFQDKVLGSFVRIKSDPNDYLQKNSHQLQQVIGITSKADNLDSEIHLRLSNYFRDVPLHLLSDDNLTEDECVDLHERVKAGTLKRPTVVELEAKAKILHEDITKHWISREISLLKTLIDRANEKGRRRELFSYLERKQTLEKPAEREKLLSEIPKVIADALEIESIETAPENVEESFNVDPIDINCNNGHGLQPIDHVQEATHPALVIISEETDTETPVGPTVGTRNESSQMEATEVVVPTPVIAQMAADAVAPVVPRGLRNESSQTAASDFVVPTPVIAQTAAAAVAPVIPVIELSDDDDEEVVEEPRIQNPTVVIHPDVAMWLYLDPQGQVQGPFSLTSLKRWHDHKFFGGGFKVWKMDQAPSDALLLTDALRMAFPL